MKNIITEDIIRNALNESIEEFMLEEGAFGGLKNWRNQPYMQTARNYVGKVYNGLKNAAAMYMDARTNGRWNNKYGIYANGNGKATELFYLNKWFNTHLNNIRQIEYRNNTPDADFSKKREYVVRNGEKVYTDMEIQEKDILTYVQKNITSQNFNYWLANFITNRQELKLINDYIEKCQKNITDLQSAMKWLNTGSFISDPIGQQYLKTSNNNLAYQRQQYQNDKKGIINLFNYLYNNKDRITKKLLYNNIQNLGQNFSISEKAYGNVKNYLNRLIKMLNDEDTLNKRYKFLNANSFFKSGYGKKFY